MTNVICIICPKGCHLSVDENNNYEVTGHGCPRGVAYGQKELTNPTRVVTSTVKIKDSLYPYCPVKTNGEIPKDKVRASISLLKEIELKPPVKIGDVVVANIFGTGVNFVVTKNVN